jgi:hypothetical protein
MDVAQRRWQPVPLPRVEHDPAHSGTGMTFTYQQKAEVAEREVKQRKRVYPRWVADKRMTQEFADYQIAVMEAIALEFRYLASVDERKERLL